MLCFAGDDADHDLVEGEDISEEAAGNELNESHEEQHKENEGAAEKVLKKEIAVEEGDVKAEDGEYSVDVSKDSTLSVCFIPLTDFCLAGDCFCIFFVYVTF